MLQNIIGKVLFWADNRIPLCLCGGVCPITQNPFKANDMVYVLKTESHNIPLRKSVPLSSKSFFSECQETFIFCMKRSLKNKNGKGFLCVIFPKLI